jgi:hypothetical protein
MIWHILYVSYEEGGRDYVGAHSTIDLNDGYLGSYTDKTFIPKNRIIVGYYKTRESLILAEESLQRSLNVAVDPQYANRSIQTSTGFDRYGVKDTPETVLKKVEANLGEKNGFFGKSHTRERKEEWSKKRKGRKDNLETRIKKSRARTGAKQTLETKRKIAVGRTGQTHSEITKTSMSEDRTGTGNPAYGRKWWVNSKNETVYQENSPGTEWQRGRKWKTVK